MANRRQSDTILYCERCGISFLWPVEEQRVLALAMPDHDEGPLQAETSAAAPLLCPGCRALLPSGGRERGLVKWYNGRKRFGFIVRRSEDEIFVPGASLQGKQQPQPGDLVEFGVAMSERGPVAQEVRIIATAAEVDQPLAEIDLRTGRRSVAARTRGFQSRSTPD